MKDLAIALEDRPGALAEMGDAFGRAGVSIEGGGAWVVDGRGVAAFDAHAGAAEGVAHFGECAGAIVEFDGQVLHS